MAQCSFVQGVHKLLFQCQSGFRLRSTSTSVTTVTGNILTEQVFLHWNKAFDTLDHDILFDKLSSFGFGRSAVQWFKSYLRNRTQSVCANGMVSEPREII